MDVIRLSQEWKVKEPLARGGFASVFLAEAEDGSEAVVKLIPKEPGADRELLFGDIPKDVPNVLPVLDKGEWDDKLVLVMPKAEQSLRQHLDAKGQLEAGEAVAILLDVAIALQGLHGKVVHRDLKPENVLFYGGHWVLADFGIARYAEASTAPDTRKHAMTPGYAAPEQWRSEHATSATDVYAFGVMAFELVEGGRPFEGPGVADFRQQHLDRPAPVPTKGTASLASLIGECLYKPPQARPTPANLRARLEAVGRPASPAQARLQQVQKNIVQSQLEKDARESAQKSVEQQRRELVQVAKDSLATIEGLLEDRVRQNAPSATIRFSRGSLEIQLGKGLLAIDAPQSQVPRAMETRGREAAFDVVAATAIVARQPMDRYQKYEGRAHSLWFCDAQQEGVYRWYELAFMVSPFIAERYSIEPFSMPPSDEDAAMCFASITSTRQLAWPPQPFDQGEEDQFIERWMGWLADAAEGRLSHPQSMPEKRGEAYRRAKGR